jgi:hypothetical protein
MYMNIENKLVVTADRDDYAVGLIGRLSVGGFSGAGDGWHNNSDVLEFCSKLTSLSESMEGTAELLGTEMKPDRSEYLETFCIRIYPLDRSKLNGTVGVHITLSIRPYTGCRPEEISKVSAELKTLNHHLAKFSKDLKDLVLGDLEEVCLYGENNI